MAHGLLDAHITSTAQSRSAQRQWCSKLVIILMSYLRQCICGALLLHSSLGRETTKHLAPRMLLQDAGGDVPEEVLLARAEGLPPIPHEVLIDGDPLPIKQAQSEMSSVLRQVECPSHCPNSVLFSCRSWTPKWAKGWVLPVNHQRHVSFHDAGRR